MDMVTGWNPRKPVLNSEVIVRNFTTRSVQCRDLYGTLH